MTTTTFAGAELQGALAVAAEAVGRVAQAFATWVASVIDAVHRALGPLLRALQADQGGRRRRRWGLTTPVPRVERRTARRRSLLLLRQARRG